jgi:hypothetical protein
LAPRAFINHTSIQSLDGRNVFPELARHLVLEEQTFVTRKQAISVLGNEPLVLLPAAVLNR